MYIVVGLAVGLLIAGLVAVWLCSGIKQPLLRDIVYWIGIVLVVVGLVLLLTPAIVWINAQLRAILGV